jgi:hypothetical protein
MLKVLVLRFAVTAVDVDIAVRGTSPETLVSISIVRSAPFAICGVEGLVKPEATVTVHAVPLERTDVADVKTKVFAVFDHEPENVVVPQPDFVTPTAPVGPTKPGRVTVIIPPVERTADELNA